MKEQFCTYEIALALKELGFDDRCLGRYSIKDKELILLPLLAAERTIPAPLWQQVQLWFLNKKDINIEINDYNGGWMFRIFSRKGVGIYFEQNIGQIRNNSDDYMEVLEQAILKAIELIENDTTR